MVSSSSSSRIARRPRAPVPRWIALRAIAPSGTCWPVVWLMGPPGAGKTVLASDYLARRRLTTLWYQVDGSDSDIATLLRRLPANLTGTEQLLVRSLVTRALAASVHQWPGHARVRVDSRHLRPHRRHQQERYEAQQEVDEGDQRDLLIDGSLAAVTTTSVDACHFALTPTFSAC